MDVNPQREPVLAYNMILSFIRSGLIMLIALDVIFLNESQMEAVLAFFAAGSLVVDGLVNAYVRSQVVPMRKFRKRVQTAISAGQSADVRAPIVPRPPEP